MIWRKPNWVITLQLQFWTLRHSLLNVSCYESHVDSRFVWRTPCTKKKGGFEAFQNISTGAEISVYPLNSYHESNKQSFSLFVCNGSEIKTCGSDTFNLDFWFKVKQTFNLALVVAHYLLKSPRSIISESFSR